MQSVIKNSGKASASARMLMPEATTQVTLHDVDRFPVALREKMLQKQDLTSRTISSYDHILYRGRPSLAVSSACVHCLCVCVCVLSELLVCCGHPQQHRSDTPASTQPPPCLLSLRLCVCMCLCMHVWSSWFFGIATASSLDASLLLLAHIHL